jgi:hypothetical protein
LAEGDPEARQTPAGAYTDAYLETLGEAALFLLYRLLFLFYAEDRRLLPVMDGRYGPYSLSELREAIAKARDTGQVLSTRSTRYWDALTNLFRLVCDGDDAVGMPAYNGGLFLAARSPLEGVDKIKFSRNLAPENKREGRETWQQVGVRRRSARSTGRFCERSSRSGRPRRSRRSPRS